MDQQHRPRHALEESVDDVVTPSTSGRRTPRHSGRGKKVGAALLAFLLVLAAAGYGLYRHFNANLTSVDMPSDIQGSQIEGFPTGTAMNFVILGTDSRASSENCKLGGMCGEAKIDGETNADVEMVVHVAADHKSMTVLTIPRDTVVDVPACSGNGKTTKPYRARINSSLNYGTDCTLRTIHNLTGLPIHHFMMVDFSGVISLSDAVGGVDVCVDNDVYDTYSHLKLAKGKHTLQGVAALQFVRSRHGFGDGGDLGRTQGQQLYLSAAQRKLESAGTLLNPAKVYRLAEAGTKALTVDKGLASVTTLARLGATLGSIPTSSTTFVTLPTTVDPTDQNRRVPAEAKAKAIFAKMLADEPLAVAKTPAPSHANASQPASSTPTAAATSATPSATHSATPSAASTPTGDPAVDGEAQVSSETTGCAKVSTLDTVMVNGKVMNPTEAFHATPNIPVSAP